MNKHDHATGSAAISYSLAPTNTEQILEVRIHLSAAGGAGNLTITHNSALGAAYDVNLLTQDMTAVQDLVWNPDGDFHELAPGDSFDIAWANANTRTYGLEVIYR